MSEFAKTFKDLESEKAVIGCVLLNNEVIENALEIVTPLDFFDPTHQRIFSTMQTMYQNNDPLDPLSVSKRTLDMYPDSVLTEGLLEEIQNSAPSPSSIDFFAQRVVRESVRREAGKILDLAKKEIEDADDPMSKISETVSKMEGVRSNSMDQTVFDFQNVFVSRMEVLERRSQGEVENNTISTGLKDLDDLLNGGLRFQHFDVLAARPAMGKMSPKWVGVLMEDGSWKKMGDLEIGDRLASVDGEENLVTGIYPQGVRSCYHVEFSDGRSTYAGGEHNWKVGNRKWDEDKVLTTDEISELLEKHSYKNRLYIPLVNGEFGDKDCELKINPWVLGALIGDGCFSKKGKIKFTKSNEFVVSKLKKLSKELGELKTFPNNKKEHYFVKAKKLSESIEYYQLSECYSWQKFIPREYLEASESDRWLLLQGLMDTDGWCEKHGSIRYSTASERLANDVQYLVRSLGGVCGISVKQPHYTYEGVKKKGRLAYVLNIRFEDGQKCFSVENKKARAIRSRNTSVRLNISSISYFGEEDQQCISVSHPSKLYVTDDFIVTHNTSLAVQWVVNACLRQNISSLIFSIEMSKEEIIDKMISNEGNIPYHKLSTGDLKTEDWDTLIDLSNRMLSSPENPSKSGIFVDDVTKDLHRMIAVIRRCVRKYNVKFVVIDYLQLITIAGKFGTRDEQLGYAVNLLAYTAKTLNINILALSQLNRGVESRDSKRPSLSDLRESGNIEQAAWRVFSIYRDDYYNHDSPEKGLAEIGVLKGKISNTGKVQVYFDKECTKFSSLTWEGR